MAGVGWIKITEDLHEKPEVLKMAELLKTRPEHVVGYCVRFWSWCVRNSSDGVVRDVSKESVERVLNLPDFLSILQSVGWLDYIERPDATYLSIPHFDRHMSESAKKRILDAERKRGERVRNLSEKKRTKLGPEKRREEKNKKSNKKTRTDEQYTEAFERFWTSFSRVRRTKKAEAWRAWQAMRCEEIAERVIAASVAYAKSAEGRGEFCQGPAPWLRAGRWDDHIPGSGPRPVEATQDLLRRDTIIREGRRRGLTEEQIGEALVKAGVNNG